MALLSGLQTGLDAIYPARCLACGGIVDGDFGLCGPCWRDTSFIGGTVCDACGVPLPGVEGADTPHCDACMQMPPPWVRGRAAMLYRDTGRKLVLALKHGDRQEIAHPAGLWLSNAIQDVLTRNTLIAPVPLHWHRMIKRRYNQSALLARALSRRVDRPWCPDLLQRFRRTRSLDGLSRVERIQTVQGAIRVHPRRRHRLIGRPVLLVDDVMTSGATLSACTQACLDAGSGPVCVVTLARVAKDA
ncbi:ComF family protein [Sulfitobacter noctilucicola]|uniref:ComF family protein n=1 Tax=Sulfitobacter noctilucicola TaxID=1342301 RepID=A0A7W6M5A2_9RHOB|nr:ComF family protein [Sulfitobacter noctilucicola]MBB4172679.1 ComF family protein [Sulfitobacter noctilucicola]